MMYCVKVVMMVAALVSTYESAYGQSIGHGQCPDVSVLSHFNPIRYIGRWYEVKRTPNPFELLGSCVTSDYALEKNYLLVDTGNLLVTNSMKNWRGRISSINGRVVPLDKSSDQAKYILSYYGHFFSYPYWVLDTDYDTFSVVYSCNSIMGLFHMKYLWLLSRTPEPTKIVSGKMNLVLQQKNLTSIFLKKTDQKNCDYPKP